MFHFNYIIGILGIASLVTGRLIFVALRQRQTAGNGAFCLMMVAVTLWLFTATFEIASNSLAFKILMSKIQYLGASSVAWFWLVFVLRYTHHDRYLTRQAVWLMGVIPVVTMALAATNEWHRLVWPEIEVVPVVGGIAARFSHGPAVAMISAYSYVLLSIGAVILFKVAYRLPSMYRRQAYTLVLSALMPWVGNIIYLAGLSPIPWLDLTPLAFAITGILMALTVFRFRLLEVMPVAHDVVFWGISDGIIVMDLQGKVLDLNPTARQLLNLGDEAVGCPVTDVLGAWPDLALLCGGASDAEGEWPVETAEGQKWFNARHSKVVVRGLAVGRLLTLRDITGWRKAEREKQALENQFLQTQKLESLGIMAGGIAHDFNNLLMVVSGNLEFARQALSADHPVQTDLGEAEQAVKRASQLTHQLLAYSGRSRLAMAPLNLNDLLCDMARMLEVSVARRATLAFRLVARVPFVMGDDSQIRQLIMNLVLNAAEAIETRDGKVTVATGIGTYDSEAFSRMWLHDELPGGEYVWMEVADNGAGMPEEVLNKIFDPFFTTKFTGRGLGLAAVLGIVRSHRGAIHVESSPGKGTLFRVYLPVLAEESAASRAQATEAPSLAPGSGFGKILLVDDEPVVRWVGRRMLESMGFEVLVAEDGVVGVETFTRNQDSIRCVVMDLTMPRMTGVEALAAIRKLKPDVPAILISGYSRPMIATDDQARIKFLHKPFARADLAAMLQECLR